MLTQTVLMLTQTVLMLTQTVLMLTQTVLMLAQFIFTSINLCSPFNNTSHSNHLQAVLILTIREDNFSILIFLHKPCIVNKAALTHSLQLSPSCEAHR